MLIRKVIVQFDEGRRLVLYPAGGMGLEVHVPPIGWVVSEANQFDGDQALSAALDEAAGMAQACALNLLQAVDDRPWTVEEILAREG